MSLGLPGQSSSAKGSKAKGKGGEIAESKVHESPRKPSQRNSGTGRAGPSAPPPPQRLTTYFKFRSTTSGQTLPLFPEGSETPNVGR